MEKKHSRESQIIQQQRVESVAENRVPIKPHRFGVFFSFWGFFGGLVFFFHGISP